MARHDITGSKKGNVRVSIDRGRIYDTGGFKIGDTEFLYDDVAKNLSALLPVLTNLNTPKNNPDLGRNDDTPLGKAAGVGLSILDTIGAKTAHPNGKLNDPLRRIGLRAYGGNIYAIGGDYLKAGTSAVNLFGNALNQASLTTDYKDFQDALDSNMNAYRESFGNITDNDALLSAYDNMSYFSDGVTAKDFRDKSLFQDATGALSAGMEGLNAGKSFGPWGAAIGAAVGLGSSIVGSIVGRNKAKRAAKKANEAVTKANSYMDSMVQKQADAVDAINDRKRVMDFMNNYFDYALGGELSTHGSDFTNGLTFINSGGTHEENPLGGVPAGIDDAGTPNLVEQDEVVWDNNYVFSNRIEVPENLRRKYKLRKGTTFADAVRRLTPETLKRPNDPISKDTNKSILSELREAQEGIRSQIFSGNMADLMDILDAGQGISYPMESQVSGQEVPVLDIPESQTGLGVPRFAYGGNLFYPGGPKRSRYASYPDDETVPFHDLMEVLAEEFSADSPSSGKEGKKDDASATKGKRRYSVGTFKRSDYASNWNAYSRSGVTDYMKRQVKAYQDAKTPEEKRKVQDETMSVISTIQNGYKNSYESSNQYVDRTHTMPKSDVVRTHQSNWHNLINGNSGFGKIADAQNLPEGHASGDDAAHGWVDGLWGPQTYLRNAGSNISPTDDMRELVEGFRSMGLEYSPTLEYGNGQKLYMLSRNEGDTRPELPELEKGTPPQIPVTSLRDGLIRPETLDPGNNPKRRFPDNTDLLRMAPIYGSGLLALNGILGSPDYSDADAMIQAARLSGRPVSVPVTTIGDYRRKRPFDERYLVNLANQNRAAAVRGGANTAGGNRAMQLGFNSVLARNNQQELGEIMRQAYLANRADDAQVSEFNRGTNQFNASSINQRNLTQAQLNNNRQAQSIGAMQRGYMARQAVRDAYDAATGQNISNFLNNLGIYGKERASDRMLWSMAENGYFPYGWNGYDLSYFQHPEKGYVLGEPRSNGGELRKKKRRF